MLRTLAAAFTLMGLLGCAPTTPAAKPSPLAVPAQTGANRSITKPSETALDALRLLDPDSKAVVRIDGSVLRRWPAFGVLPVLWATHIKSLSGRRPSTQCLARVVDLMGVSAVGARGTDAYLDVGLWVAELPAGESANVVRCLAKDASSQPTRFDGHASFVLGNAADAWRFVATDRFLVLGRPPVLARALRRAKAMLPTIAGLRAEIPQGESTIAGIAVRNDALEKLTMKLWLQGASLELALKLVVASPSSSESDKVAARFFSELTTDVAYLADDLAEAFGGSSPTDRSHPWVAALAASGISRNGAAISASFTFPAFKNMAGFLVRRAQRKRLDEVKGAVGAIARDATAAFERETADVNSTSNTPIHRLCTSAVAVPTRVPPFGKPYRPDNTEGHDFETGDNQTGWRCLKFGFTEPLACQYDYRAGGGYKGPKRGGPDPGPHGYEASAECDLAGDSATTLVTFTATVDPARARLGRGVMWVDLD